MTSLIAGLLLSLPGAPVPVDVDVRFPVDMVLRGRTLYVVDFGANVCWALDPDTGRAIRRFGGHGQGPGEIIRPEKAWFHQDRLWLFSHEAKMIATFDPDTGAHVETIRVRAPGFAVGVWDHRLIMAGQSPGRFDPAGAAIALYPLVSGPTGRQAPYLRPGDPRRAAYLAPSDLSRRARGWMQQHLALWLPEQGVLFYGDPLDFTELTRLDLNTGQSEPIALPVFELTAWDGEKPLKKALPELDLYHASGHVWVPTPRGPFLFVTWRRAVGGFLTAILDIKAGVPAGSLVGDRAPVGALDGRMVFWSDPDSPFLQHQPLADVFLEGTGRNPFAPD